jgi:hypothetical protein
MVKYACDRCKKEFVEESELGCLRITSSDKDNCNFIGDDWKGVDGDGFLKGDLCDSCLKEIVKFALPDLFKEEPKQEVLAPQPAAVVSEPVVVSVVNQSPAPVVREE